MIRNKNLKWSIQTFSDGFIGFKKDNRKEIHEANVKKKWEIDQPGRAAKAKRSRQKFLRQCEVEKLKSDTNINSNSQKSLMFKSDFITSFSENCSGIVKLSDQKVVYEEVPVPKPEFYNYKFDSKDDLAKLRETFYSIREENKNYEKSIYNERKNVKNAKTDKIKQANCIKNTNTTTGTTIAKQANKVKQIKEKELLHAVVEHPKVEVISKKNSTEKEDSNSKLINFVDNVNEDNSNSNVKPPSSENVCGFKSLMSQTIVDINK